MPVWSPETAAETLTELAPGPASCIGVCRPYFVLVPYSKYHFVSVPFGFTVPFRVAEVAATLLAVSVLTVGADAAAATPARASAPAATARTVWNVLTSRRCTRFRPGRSLPPKESARPRWASREIRSMSTGVLLAVIPVAGDLRRQFDDLELRLDPLHGSLPYKR